MPKSLHQFASDLAQYLLQENTELALDTDNPGQLLARKDDDQFARLDVTPILAETHTVTANPYFAGVETTSELLNAYQNCIQHTLLEDSIPGAMQNVNPYAEQFRQRIFERAQDELSHDEARVIAQWVAQLDSYSALKSIESLLNNPADRVLLSIAQEHNWLIYMDHLAIRCGSQNHGDAKRVADYLRQNHGYVQPQAEGQAYYLFDDGWDAYPLYKMLDNGQMMRLFIDESCEGYPQQIIQHWNHTYGFTAHHLALRVCRPTKSGLVAVALTEIIAALANREVNCMTPTGAYTAGLLEQVFTVPSKTPDVPAQIKQNLKTYDKDLEKIIENGKLIELVSRREMPAELAERYFDLYGLSHDPSNPNHSAPCYCYFLPAQAAHVIRTSIDVN